jgi:hypothetical protein
VPRSRRSTATRRSILEGLRGYAGDMRGLVVEAIIICPLCAHEALEAMPTDACQHVYPCQGCGELAPTS